MITSSQIKASRALLGLTTAKLAKLSGIGFTTLVRLESFEGVPSANIKTLESGMRAFAKQVKIKRAEATGGCLDI